MATEPRTAEDALAAGSDALRRGEWKEARDHFQSALAAEETGAAWEGLGWAGWWLHDPDLTIGTRERAYRAFRGAGDRAGAGRVAAWLASDYLEFRGEDAVARGWLERSRRMLDDLPEGEEHGWLALNEGGYAANVDADLERAGALAASATALGRKLGVADLEAVGLALEGITLVRRGAVEEGMRLLDEASVVAASEDVSLPIARGWALCYLISACEGVGDFRRAVQWCEIAGRLAERWGARQMLGVCRSAYGNVLATNGDWAAAEQVLTAAVGDLQAARPGMAAGGLARLGALRVRQGRIDEARALFEQAGAHRLALVGLGSLASTTATRPPLRTRPSALCAGCRRPRSWTGCPRWSSSRAPASRSASSMQRPRCAPSWNAWAPSSARRTCAAAPVSRPVGWRRRGAITRRRGGRARTPSTC
jgi:tetratricopeptide (TPR) repeat protein